MVSLFSIKTGVCIVIIMLFKIDVFFGVLNNIYEKILIYFFKVRVFFSYQLEKKYIIKILNILAIAFFNFFSNT